jgi:hypothetical protein
MHRRDSLSGHHEGDVPWASFADGLTGLLFVFILLTGMFVIDAQNAKQQVINRLNGAANRAERLATISENGSVARCLNEANFPGLILIQGAGGTDEAAALSMRLDDDRTTSVGWFDKGEAKLKGDACDVTKVVATCLAEAVADAKNEKHKILEKGDTLRVLVEGHTDVTPVLSGPYPSNWELSGARAAALVRALTDGTSTCAASHDDRRVLLEALDTGDLQLIAVGRADQAPSRAVICKEDRTDKVCDCKGRPSQQAQCLDETLKKTNGQTRQQRLISWANGGEDDSKRLLRQRLLRRVDLRFEVRPATTEVASGD